MGQHREGNTKNEPPKPSRLFVRRDVDEQDEQELSMSRALTIFHSLTAHCSEREVTQVLMEKATSHADGYIEMTQALLYAMLTLPLQNNHIAENSPEFILSIPCSFDQQGSTLLFGYLQFIVSDGYKCCVDQIDQLIKKFHKLQENVKIQLLWIFSYLMNLNLPEMDSLFILLLRNISGGDLSIPNIWLTYNMLILILQHNRTNVLNNSILIPNILYTFLRLIPDHIHSRHEHIRNLEIRLCSDLLTNKIVECSVIGRDLVRLFQDVVKIPIFGNIWKEIFTKSVSSLLPNVVLRNGQTPQMTFVDFLLTTKTPKTYPQLRVTPEMDTQIAFILSQVKMGNQKRYQDWFAAKFLSSSDSDSLIPDLIRFICCCIHPTNAILATDILPRWAFIGWIFRCVKTPIMTANAKLCLFYDWMFFDEKRGDNIMNIEPALLLMMKSMPKYDKLTSTLLDFLLSVMEFYDPKKKEMIVQGVHNSLSIMIKKGVVNNIVPLFTCPALDTERVRKMVELWNSIYRDYIDKGDFPPQWLKEHNLEDVRRSSVVAAASESEEKKMKREDILPPLAETRESPKSTSMEASPSTTIKPEVVEGDVSSQIDQREVMEEEYNLPELMEKMLHQPLENVTRLTDAFVRQELEDSATDEVITCLHGAMSTELEQISCTDISQRDEPSILNTFFSHLDTTRSTSTPQQSDRTSKLLYLISKMDETISLRVLLYLVTRHFENFPVNIMEETEMKEEKTDGRELSIYRSMLYHRPEEARELFVRDMKRCGEDIETLFHSLVPIVCRYLPEIACGCTEFIQLIVTTIDAVSLNNLTSRLYLRDIRLFGDKLMPVLDASCLCEDDGEQWDTFAQTWLWQLILAEFSSDITDITDVLVQLFKRIQAKFAQRQEVLYGFVQLLRSSTPTSRLLMCLLELKYTGPLSTTFTVLFQAWSKSSDFSSMLVDSVNQMMSVDTTVSTNGLKHLEHVRKKYADMPIWKDQQAMSSIQRLFQHVHPQISNHPWGLTTEKGKTDNKTNEKTSKEKTEEDFGLRVFFVSNLHKVMSQFQSQADVTSSRIRLKMAFSRDEPWDSL
ncbi:hypothetical protein PROFUN_00881 [Planoprotostelium fungivorum]|uniref:SOSS complex subunit A homolog n=1 Tax=Planoprotostelium fungivorum TaxID=1890364 RepID=A0A2P6P0A6_9EUKA|nr:hypothetical protein PROFUN_00881 [Planoprotostelium fungivorum]